MLADRFDIQKNRTRCSNLPLACVLRSFLRLHIQLPRLFLLDRLIASRLPALRSLLLGLHWLWCRLLSGRLLARSWRRRGLLLCRSRPPRRYRLLLRRRACFRTVAAFCACCGRRLLRAELPWRSLLRRLEQSQIHLPSLFSSNKLLSREIAQSMFGCNALQS